MANTKRKRNAATPNARPKTETAEVASPFTHGKIDYVSRVADTLTSMYNRKQLTQLQFAAGDRYRMSHERTSASAGGSMDFDRSRGASGPSQGYAEIYTKACEDVSDAKLKLYPDIFAMVHRVSVIGLTIEAAAKQLHDPQWHKPWPQFHKEATLKFHMGLDTLAAMWWPVVRIKRDPKTGEEIRQIRNVRNGKSTVTDAPAPNRNSSGVVHATRDKIYRGPQRR